VFCASGSRALPYATLAEWRVVRWWLQHIQVPGAIVYWIMQMIDVPQSSA
jgi:hypothetical protein